MNHLAAKFDSYPTEIQEWLLSLIDENGPAPMGEALIRNTDIYQIAYSVGTTSSFRWHTGQTRSINVDGKNVSIQIVKIYYDYPSSVEMKAPVYVVSAMRVDTQKYFIYRYIVNKEVEIICHPPESKPLRL